MNKSNKQTSRKMNPNMHNSKENPNNERKNTKTKSLEEDDMPLFLPSYSNTEGVAHLKETAPNYLYIGNSIATVP